MYWKLEGKIPKKKKKPASQKVGVTKFILRCFYVGQNPMPINKNINSASK